MIKRHKNKMFLKWQLFGEKRVLFRKIPLLGVPVDVVSKPGVSGSESSKLSKLFTCSNLLANETRCFFGAGVLLNKYITYLTNVNEYLILISSTTISTVNWGL